MRLDADYASLGAGNETRRTVSCAKDLTMLNKVRRVWSPKLAYHEARSMRDEVQSLRRKERDQCGSRPATQGERSQSCAKDFVAESERLRQRR